MGFIFQTSAGAQDSLLFKMWGLVYLFSVCVHSCVVLCVCIWLYTHTHICRGKNNSQKSFPSCPLMESRDQSQVYRQVLLYLLSHSTDLIGPKVRLCCCEGLDNKICSSVARMCLVVSCQTLYKLQRNGFPCHQPSMLNPEELNPDIQHRRKQANCR